MSNSKSSRRTERLIASLLTIGSPNIHIHTNSQGTNFHGEWTISVKQFEELDVSDDFAQHEVYSSQQ